MPIYFIEIQCGQVEKLVLPRVLILRHWGAFMIVFDRLWVTMEKQGISTYKLREWSGIDSRTIRRLRANENIETNTLDKLCTALSCQLEDIAEHKVDL